jgi:hypothetical protein
VNLPRSHMARPRFGSARWPAAHAPTANQLTRQDDSRPDRPLIQGVRSASVPASIGGFTGDRPASFPLLTPALDALIAQDCRPAWLRTPIPPASPRPNTPARAGGTGALHREATCFFPGTVANFAPNALNCGHCSGRGRFESSALPPSQTPQFGAAYPNHRFCPPILSGPRTPAKPDSGREERAAASTSTSQAESLEISFATP